jgi:hypothetical protein
MNVRRILVGVVGALGGLLILLALLLWFVYASLDSIVENVLETRGSQLAGANLRVEDVDISPQSGEGVLRGLRIENPPGFSRADVIRFGEIRLRIDVSTLVEDPLVIEEIRIEAPHVNYEVKPPGRSNIDAIRESLERQGRTEEAGQPQDPAPAPTPGPAGRRVVVRTFGIENGSVAADARALGGKQFEGKLPALRLSNLGGSEGAPADEVGRTVLAAFTQTVAKSIASRGLGKVLEEKAGGAGEAAKGLLDRLGE